MKRLYSETQQHHQHPIHCNQGKSGVEASDLVKKLADEISTEREKKRRLEWYLSEVMKEREQLMRENSERLQSLNREAACTTPTCTASSVERPQSTRNTSGICDEYDSSVLREGSTTSSPSLSPLCSSPTLTTAPLIEAGTTEELCCGTAPAFLAVKCEPIIDEESLGQQFCTTTTSPTASFYFTEEHRPCLDEPTLVPASCEWLAEEPTAATLRSLGSGVSCAQEAKKEELEGCLDLDVSWFGQTDEQDLISTLQEYFS